MSARTRSRSPPGSMIWPVSGAFTSPFGPRWGRLHAGIDLAAPEGTPIRAAESGRVVLAGWTGGYGNYTCIAHGGEIRDEATREALDESPEESEAS